MSNSKEWKLVPVELTEREILEACAQSLNLKCWLVSGALR